MIGDFTLAWRIFSWRLFPTNTSRVFHVASTWNTRGVFVGFVIAMVKDLVKASQHVLMIWKIRVAWTWIYKLDEAPSQNLLFQNQQRQR